jgi:hypothetical protein
MSYQSRRILRLAIHPEGNRGGVLGVRSICGKMQDRQMTGAQKFDSALLLRDQRKVTGALREVAGGGVPVPCEDRPARRRPSALSQESAGPF